VRVRAAAVAAAAGVLALPAWGVARTDPPTRPVVKRVVILPPIAPLAPLSAPPSSPQLGAQPPVYPDRPGALEVAVSSKPAQIPLLVAAVNEVRRAHGLRTLVVSPRLTAAANAHARVLAATGRFAHEWSDGSPFGTWILRYYPVAAYTRWSAGENLVWSAQPLVAGAAVDEWIASPPHRRNLLDPAWRQVGIGVAGALHAGGVYGGYDVDVGAAEFGVRR
jgi:uncharacterized protein YkwD